MKYIKLIVFAIVIFIVLGYLYTFSPRKLEFLGHYNKVFAHRVNSLEKQREALKYFEGIEFDLNFDNKTGVLDVNHPPTKSIGLTFETYLEGIKLNEFPFLWLDIKKLDTTNSNAILLKLNSLFETRNYPKSKILIETQSPEVLPKFSSAGYKTSYYLKPKLYKKTPKDLKKEIEYIDSILAKQPESGISTNYEDYTILRRHFPKKTKYLWVLTSPFKPQFKKVKTILNDSTVAIVLTSFKAINGNR